MLLRRDSSKSVNDARFRNKTAVLFLCLAIVFLLIQFPSPASCSTTPATYYVLAGGAGNCSGFDWNNAGGKIPSNLNPGDIVYLGGSAGNLASTSNTPCPGERTHTFSSSGSASSHIQIVKCTSSISACTSAAGWQAGFGTASAYWNDPNAPSAGAPTFWEFCGNYYDVTGSYGTSDQAGTYGIYMLASSNLNYVQMWSNHGSCPAAAQSNYTFQYMEIAGTTPRSLYGTGGADGFYLLGNGTSYSISNVAINSVFIHDIFQPFSLLNVSTFTLHDSWMYRNFCNSAAHSQGLQSQSYGLLAGNLSTGNLTIYNTIWRNIQGTGIIMCLNGQCPNWAIYNNVVWYDSTWNSTNCAYGDSTASCAISKFVGDNGTGSTLTSAVVYGNTIAFAKNVSPCNCGADDAGVVVNSSTSSNVTVENNLWYSSTQSNIYTTVVPVNHDYNEFINGGAVMTTMNTHEFHSNSGSANPFTNSGGGDFTLASSGNNAPSGCAAGTNCYANGATLSSPYNVDLTGAAHGGTNGWTRGAFQYGSTTGSLPNPPTFLTATVQ